MLWRGFQKPKRLAVDNETLTTSRQVFGQPFERGFGTHWQCASPAPCSRPSKARFTPFHRGVLHEFQSITRVVEDATDIILNLKQIPFKLNGEAPRPSTSARTPPRGHSARSRRRDVESSTGRLHLHHLRGGKIDMNALKPPWLHLGG